MFRVSFMVFNTTFNNLFSPWYNCLLNLDNQYIRNLLSLHAILNYSFFFITFRFGNISFRFVSFDFVSFYFVSYITHSPVALPFHPIQGKRRERPIKIHCRVIWRRNWRCLGLSWKMHGFYIRNLLSLHAILNYSFFFITFRFEKNSFRFVSFDFVWFRFTRFVRGKKRRNITALKIKT
jgi:hypothetical protein